MRIIPAIDIIEGKCVRLSKGDYNTKRVYSEDPLEMARRFEGSGIEYLHLVDLDGAKAGEIINYRILDKISTKTNLKIDFGGGIKTGQDLVMALECGARQVTAGSIAVRDEALVGSWIKMLGSKKIILGADVNNKKIAVDGWTQTSDLELIPFLEGYTQRGIQYVICTDISKDGMLEGPSTALYKEILTSFPKLSLIASGGVTSMDDIYSLQEVGCEGAIIGKAIYENRISLKQLESYILSTNQ